MCSLQHMHTTWEYNSETIFESPTPSSPYRRYNVLTCWVFRPQTDFVCKCAMKCVSPEWVWESVPLNWKKKKKKCGENRPDRPATLYSLAADAVRWPWLVTWWKSTIFIIAQKCVSERILLLQIFQNGKLQYVACKRLPRAIKCTTYWCGIASQSGIDIRLPSSIECSSIIMPYGRKVDDTMCYVCAKVLCRMSSYGFGYCYYFFLLLWIHIHFSSPIAHYDYFDDDEYVDFVGGVLPDSSAFRHMKRDDSQFRILCAASTIHDPMRSYDMKPGMNMVIIQCRA